MLLIDREQLQTGDIILIRSNSDISQRVRKLTGSSFSHALLYVGVSSCIESDGEGVQSQNIQRVLIDDKESAKVLRLRESQPDKIQEVIVFARQKIGTQYSLKEAVAVLNDKNDEAKEPNRQFCTRFVAQAYENAGINLVDNSNYCTPEELLKSEKLIEVENILKEATEKEIEFAKSDNPLERQQQIHNLILSSARKISGEDIQTFEQLSKYVIEHPDKEPEVTKVVRESGYLTFWKGDVEKNPWHYDYDKFMEHYKNPQQALEMALFFATTESETRERFFQTLDALKFGYSFYHQEYFADEIELYEKLIELSYQREMTAIKVLKS